MRTYPLLGLGGALGVGLFLVQPVGVPGGLGLALMGALAFSQAVWNTSRVPRLAEPAYQARLQAITSMAFTLGGPLGAVWAGAAVDRFGLWSLAAGAILLALLSLAVLVFGRREAKLNPPVV